LFDRGEDRRESLTDDYLVRVPRNAVASYSAQEVEVAALVGLEDMFPVKALVTPGLRENRGLPSAPAALEFGGLD
jgi:hypothetical protein